MDFWKVTDTMNTKSDSYHMLVQCAVTRTSSGQTGPVYGDDIILGPGSQYLQFDFEIILYNDVGLTQPISEGTQLESQIPIWAKVLVTKTFKDKNQVVQVPRCSILSNGTGQSKEIIADSCSVTSDVGIISTNEAMEMTFRFQTFRFHEDNSGIYVRCEAVLCNIVGPNANPDCLCNSGSANSTCTEPKCDEKQHVFSSKKKARQSIIGVNQENDKGEPSFGPIYIRKGGFDEMDVGSSSSANSISLSISVKILVVLFFKFFF